MQYTNYSIMGHIVRYSVLLGALSVCVVIFALPLIEPSYTDSITGLIAFAAISLFIGIINLWNKPIVFIESDGIRITRLWLFSRKARWDNLILRKRVRTITRFGMIGLDPRYAILILKDATFADRWIFILPMFDNYDKFIRQLEEHIGKNNVLA